MVSKKYATKLSSAFHGTLPNGLVAPSKRDATPIYLLAAKKLSPWIKKQKSSVQSWIKTQNFSAKAGQILSVPSPGGELAMILIGYDEINLWCLAGLPMQIPTGEYHLANDADFTDLELRDLCLGWSMGCYQFTRYKKPSRVPAQLRLPGRAIDADYIAMAAQAMYLTRDLVNTPAEDMTPEHLESIARNMAKSHGAKFRSIVGDDLIAANYPLIHAVGRAGSRPPRLIDMRFGNPKHKKLTLVGKGVCFDTGGLDIKNDSGMLIMKKDMGGAAHALALAHWIMAARLPVYLRVLIPAVENNIDRNAFRPLDIFRSRKGLTVEIGNTDAEGRLILADCLSEAADEQPDLIIDFATLTGAARVALGPDLPAMFCNQTDLSVKMVHHAMQSNDPSWPMPLWKNYRPWLDSKIADINNTASQSFAGAITAALFLQEFVTPQTPWIHFDLYAWNAYDRPGRPQGGEAMCLRSVFSLLQERYKHG